MNWEIQIIKSMQLYYGIHNFHATVTLKTFIELRKKLYISSTNLIFFINLCYWYYFNITFINLMYFTL